MGVASGASGGVPRCARARGAHPAELGESSDELPRRRRHGQRRREDEGVSLVVPLEVDAVDVLHHEEHLAHQRRLVRRAAAAVGARRGGRRHRRRRAVRKGPSGRRLRLGRADTLGRRRQPERRRGGGARERRRRAPCASAPGGGESISAPRSCSSGSSRRSPWSDRCSRCSCSESASASAARPSRTSRRRATSIGCEPPGGAGMCEPRIRIAKLRSADRRSSSAGRLASMSEATSRAMSAEDDISRGSCDARAIAGATAATARSASRVRAEIVPVARELCVWQRSSARRLPPSLPPGLR